MPLLKFGQIHQDRWVYLDDSASIPVEQPVIVSLARLEGEDCEYLFSCGCSLGVYLAPDDDVLCLKPWLGRLSLISLNFPKFSDGRPYSNARLIRDRLGFRGELRACGDVLIDQYAFMLQCGFDAFEMVDEIDLQSWQRARDLIQFRYQLDISGPYGASVLAARHNSLVKREAA